MFKTCGGLRSELVFRLGLILVLVCLVTPSAHAQLFRGFISGTVTDGTDAVITGAQVTIRNLETNIAHTLMTNEAGFYRFVAVEPGNYSVEFTSSGFRARTFENVQVGTSREVVI